MTKQEILVQIDVFRVYQKYFDSFAINRNLLSPFREETEPSFKINQDGTWHDFGTGEHGDIFKFIMYKEKLNFKQSLEFLANLEGIPTNDEPIKKVVTKKLPIITHSEWLKAIDNLQEKKFPEINSILEKRKISLKICEEHGIGTRFYLNTPEIFFPLQLDDESNIIAYKSFYYKDGEKHQKSRPPVSLFPKTILNDSTDIILCEGEYDALSLLSHDFPALTGSSGASAFKMEWGEKFLLKNVTILYDNDEAGEKGAERTATILSPFARTIKIAHWDREKPGYDVGDFMQENRNLTELFEILKNAEEFKIKITETVKKIRLETDINKQKEELAGLFYDKKGMLLQKTVAEYLNNKYNSQDTDTGICCTRKGTKTIWYRYKNNYWREVDAYIIDKIILDHLKHDINDQVLSSVRRVWGRHCFVFPEEFNSQSNLINLKNFAFDLENFVPIPHKREHYFTHKNQYDFKPSAQCPNFLRALHYYSNGDEDWKKSIFEIMGYCLTGDYRYQTIFWFLGTKGGEGKSTITRIMQELTGKEFTKPNFDASKLKGDFYKKDLIGKRLAISGDLPEFLENIPTLKELSGGDWQSTDVKYQDSQNFMNCAKLVFAMNQLPQVPSSTAIKPLKRRIYILPFENPIEEVDPEFDDKIKSELSGIFNYAIEGLKRLRKKKLFKNLHGAKKYWNYFSARRPVSMIMLKIVS